MCVISNFVSWKSCMLVRSQDIKIHLSKSPKTKKNSGLVKMINMLEKYPGPQKISDNK